MGWPDAYRGFVLKSLDRLYVLRRLLRAAVVVDHAIPGDSGAGARSARLAVISRLISGTKLAVWCCLRGQPPGKMRQTGTIPAEGAAAMRVQICDDQTLFGEEFRFLLDSLHPQAQATTVTSVEGTRLRKVEL